ncbi:hypothetical protein [Streptomyces sp. NBC_01497]|uniref:hypothetical protein n=1 Tax=Streptomyces sp. NBC_01497 TaxID=2903885 RepID=UPI002E375648|nr:hypothetical protein [Streptomyces sp. NBC_01497]
MALTGCLLVAVAVAGCGRTDYAAPHDLCGIPVDSGALAVLLPPGEKVSERTVDQTEPGHDDPGALLCFVSVDGRTILQATTSTDHSYADPLDERPGKGGARIPPKLDVPIGQGAEVRSDFALAVDSCPRRKGYRRVVQVSYETKAPLPTSAAKRRTALEQLLRGLLRDPDRDVCSA